MATEQGEGGVNTSPLKPNIGGDLPNNQVNIARKPGDLAERIIANAVSELSSYGRHLRHQDLISLSAVAQTVEAMTLGTAHPKLYLSTQPTGWGKTTILVATVKAILDDPTLAHVGIVVMVNTLDQIDALIERMNLREQKYAVRAGKDEKDLNNKGLTGLCRTKGAKEIAHRYAPVLFTTQQKLSKALVPHQNDFEHMSFFDYCGAATPNEIEALKRKNSCGQKRQVRLWDEAYLPIDPVTIGLDEIARFVDRLSFLGQDRAAANVKGWLHDLQKLQPAYDTVPQWFLNVKWPEQEEDDLLRSLNDGDEKWKILYEVMFYLQGSTIKLLRQDYNKTTVAISYRRSIPHNIEPLLIFDASGNSAMEYTFLAKNEGNVQKLPSATKTYRHLALRFFDHKAGQGAYRTTSEIETLAAVAADAISDRQAGEDVLIIVRKGEKAPATTLPALIRSKVKAMGGDEERLHFLKWGGHRATNEYQHIKHVILIGILQAPLSTIIAMTYGTSSKPMRAKVSASDIEIMRMSRMIGDLNQAVGRSAVRQMTADGDVPLGCTVDLVASSVGPMGFKEPLKTLKAMFPCATVKTWHPRVSTAKPAMDLLVANAALSLLGDKSEILVTSGEWAGEAGYSTRTLQRSANKGLIISLLAEQGITLQKQGQKWLLRNGNATEQPRAA